MENKFPCTGCGQCCRNMGAKMQQLRNLKPDEAFYEEVQAFPFVASSDGSCEMLLPDGSCQVYEDRPDLCNVEFIYEKYFRETTSELMYNLQSTMVCNVMIKAAGLPARYLVKTKMPR